MSVTPERLAHFYPRLYHMAEQGSWAGIQQHGLLSTRALLDRFELAAEERHSLLSRPRKASVEISHPVHGKAVIRDQKPLKTPLLERCLRNCTPQQWLDLLNSRVFLWLTRDRLATLMCAREFRARPHLILVFDTLRLVKDQDHGVMLTPMNTGSTQFNAVPRGLSTFSRLCDYPFEERLHRGLHYAVVELTVETGILNVNDYLLEAAEMQCSMRGGKCDPVIDTIRTLYP